MEANYKYQIVTQVKCLEYTPKNSELKLPQSLQQLKCLSMFTYASKIECF